MTVYVFKKLPKTSKERPKKVQKTPKIDGPYTLWLWENIIPVDAQNHSNLQNDAFQNDTQIGWWQIGSRVRVSERA